MNYEQILNEPRDHPVHHIKLSSVSSAVRCCNILVDQSQPISAQGNKLTSRPAANEGHKFNSFHLQITKYIRNEFMPHRLNLCDLQIDFNVLCDIRR